MHEIYWFMELNCAMNQGLGLGCKWLKNAKWFMYCIEKVWLIVEY